MPQIVHANDWQAGLIPVYLETLYRDTPAYADVATVFTVHNLAYQGVFWHYDLPMTGLGWDLFTPAGLEFYGHLSLLKGGLIFADLLTTVSPTYAREIQTPEFGERLDGVLRERRADLDGHPERARRPRLEPGHGPGHRRSGSTGTTRAARPRARPRSGTRWACPIPGAGVPLVGVVSRLAAQKGLDLVAGAVPAIRAAGGQLVVLGSGEEPLERLLGELASAHPESVAVRHGIRRPPRPADLRRRRPVPDALALRALRARPAHRAPLRDRARRAADRRAADTVRAWDAASGEGTGFLFDELSADACGTALARAFTAHADPAAWRRLVANAMAADFSWDASAESYVTCYRRAIKKARRHA